MKALKSWKWLLPLSVCLLALGAWACFRAGLVQQVYVYSDRDSIREAGGSARVRSVLWSPPREMADEASPPPGHRENAEAPSRPREANILFARKSARGDFDIFERALAPDGWSESRPVEGV